MITGGIHLPYIFYYICVIVTVVACTRKYSQDGVSKLCENKEQPKKVKEMSVCSKSSLNIFMSVVSFQDQKKRTADTLIKNGKKAIPCNKDCIYKS